VQGGRQQRPQGPEAGPLRRVPQGLLQGRGHGPHELHRQVGPLLPRLLTGPALRPGELRARETGRRRVRTELRVGMLGNVVFTEDGMMEEWNYFNTQVMH